MFCLCWGHKIYTCRMFIEWFILTSLSSSLYRNVCLVNLVCDHLSKSLWWPSAASPSSCCWPWRPAWWPCWRWAAWQVLPALTTVTAQCTVLGQRYGCPLYRCTDFTDHSLVSCITRLLCLWLWYSAVYCKYWYYYNYDYDTWQGHHQQYHDDTTHSDSCKKVVGVEEDILLDVLYKKIMRMFIGKTGSNRVQLSLKKVIVYQCMKTMQLTLLIK